MISMVCRKNDVTFGTCLICKKPVSGRIDTASENVMVNGMGIARDNDIVKADICGHSGRIRSLATTVVNGKPVARVGDIFIGDYMGYLQNGSQNVAAG
jgi:uncharacterized Zn-binding protein involved in type VI secretion